MFVDVTMQEVQTTISDKHTFDSLLISTCSILQK